MSKSLRQLGEVVGPNAPLSALTSWRISYTTLETADITISYNAIVIYNREDRAVESEPGNAIQRSGYIAFLQPSPPRVLYLRASY